MITLEVFWVSIGAETKKILKMIVQNSLRKDQRTHLKNQIVIDF